MALSHDHLQALADLTRQTNWPVIRAALAAVGEESHLMMLNEAIQPARCHHRHEQLLGMELGISALLDKIDGAHVELKAALELDRQLQLQSAVDAGVLPPLDESAAP